MNNTATWSNRRKGKIMAMNDKANYTVIHHLGAAKEGSGKFTGNNELKQEAVERVQYAAADIGENVQDAAGKLTPGSSKD